MESTTTIHALHGASKLVFPRTSQGGSTIVFDLNIKGSLSTKVIEGKNKRQHCYLRGTSSTRSNLPVSVKGLGPSSNFLQIHTKHKRKFQPCFSAQVGHPSGQWRNSQVAKEQKEAPREDRLEEDYIKKFLGGGQDGTDFVSQVVRDKPSQVEPKYLIGDRLYTLKEKELLQAPFWKKIVVGLDLQKSGRLVRAGEEIAERQSTEVRGQEEKAGTSGREEDSREQVKSVFLSDLLREYKGELYVPEEAFKGHAPEVDEFQRSILKLPWMALEDFLKAVKTNQVGMLTSRGVSAPTGKYAYYDFIVDLKSIPGDKSLQTRKWAMRLTEREAQVVLKEYTGPQLEVETHYTSYVMPPPTAPHPVASSISGKVMLEMTVATGLISAVAFAFGGLASALTFTGISFVTVVVVHVLWPLVSPLLWPIKLLIWKVVEGLGIFLLGGITSDTVGRKGLPGLVSMLYRFFTSGSLFSNVRILAAILFVTVSMAGLAKFTLTRRPKDFTKWDLWQAIEFGQSKPQARVEGSTGVLFEDIAGIDDVVEELQELVTYLKDPERFNQMGTKPPHGVLMEGPPGCGKTLLAKAIAGEAGVPFYQMAGSEFVEVLVGVGAARVRDLFKRAKVNRPSVVFIDEIDALGAMRQGGEDNEIEEYNAGSQERETTLNQLLIELDGFDTGKGVVFLGATNRMDMLDPALLRPGRFDRKITVKPPRAKGRLDILKVHSKNVKLSPEVDLWIVAKNLPGWSGAELAQLLQEGAMMAVRNGHSYVLQKDLDQAVDRITVGPKRLGVGRGLPVHRRMATHEIGLAITSHILRRLEDAQIEYCERISIVARGETLSRTVFERLNDEAYFFERRPQLLHRLQVFLGGRAAEEAMFGRDTSDWSLMHLPDASWLARKLITVWNLEGPMTIHGEQPAWRREPRFSGPPLDFEGWLYDDYEFTEPSLNVHVDNEVAKRSEALVNRMYSKTLTMLQQHHAALTKAVYVLMDKQEMYGYELDLILDSYPPGTPAQVVEDEADPAALPPDQVTIEERNKMELSGTMLVDVQAGNLQCAEIVEEGDEFVRDGLQVSSPSYSQPPGKSLNRNGNGNGEARVRPLGERLEAGRGVSLEENVPFPICKGNGESAADTSVEHTHTSVWTRNQDSTDL